MKIKKFASMVFDYISNHETAGNPIIIEQFTTTDDGEQIAFAWDKRQNYRFVAINGEIVNT